MRIEINGVRHHKCDMCKRDFTEESVPHLTLEIGKASGIGFPPGHHIEGFENNWQFGRIFKEGFLDFCLPDEYSDSCIANFFLRLTTSKEPHPVYAEGVLWSDDDVMKR